MAERPATSGTLWVALTCAAMALPGSVSGQASCSVNELAVQVLGSGGPFPGSARASSGYLVWRSGRALAMVDAGGGTFLRFGEAGARLDDLEVLAISHLHPDHVSDFPALMWLSGAVRDGPLRLVGPSAGGVFPDIATFSSRLFDPDSGAFPVLGGAVGDRSRRGAPLDITVVDVERPDASVVWSDDGARMAALGVPHSSLGLQDAATPSVAYRFDVDGHSIVFGSDQNGSNEEFIDFARDADVLVMHFAVSALNAGQIHAPPATVGRIAAEAGARRLVLSHIIDPPTGVANPDRFSGPRLQESLDIVASLYTGPIEVATDLACYPL